MKKHFFLLIPISVFLLIKILNNGVYLADSGNYFYTAYQMLHNHLLYKDIFFADLPLLPIISVLYFILSGGNFLIFNYITSLEIVAIAVVIYYLLIKKTQDLTIALLSVTLFLFSAIILLASNNETFVFTAGLFLIVGYLFIIKKKFILSGIFFALSFLTKAYFIPLIGAFILATYLKYGFKATARLCVSYIITSLIILLPFILLSGDAMWKDIVEFSLNKIRPFDLGYLSSYFLTHEPLFALFLVLSIVRIKKDYFIGLASISFVPLFIFYQGMQPLYIAIIIPILCLYTPEVYSFLKNLEKKISSETMIIPLLIGLYICYNIILYGIIEANQGKISSIDEIVNEVNKVKPNYIYGTDGIAPIISYLTNIPLLRGQINTDDGLFAKGLLDNSELTQEAIDNKTIFLALGYQDSNGGMRIVNNMFDLDKIKPPRCGLVGQYLIDGSILYNHIYLFKCY